MNIKRKDKGLDNFLPNRKDVRNPRSKYLLAEFQCVVKGEMKMPNGQAQGFSFNLNELQKEILNILEVQLKYYTYEYLFLKG